MGQFGNQPDFATKVDTISAATTFYNNPKAVYIGAKTVSGTTASITVVPVGNISYDATTGTTTYTPVTFSGVNEGTFLPVMVISVTAVTNLPYSSILLYK
jgi:hypothetical protein